MYKFDAADVTATAPNVYDIVMNYYQNTVEPAVINNDIWLNARVYYGISRTASAQWDKECTNLTLYNRDVVYNQDFFAKNILTIAPQQTSDPFYTKDNLGNPSSFADPIIQTPTFTIEPNTTVTMRAGERIVGKPGFHAKAGSTARAYIDTNLASECMDGMRVENTQNTTHNNSVVLQTAVSHGKTKVEKEIEKETLIGNGDNFITPNPSSGIFTLHLKESAGEILIYNNLGQVVYQSTITDPQSTINLSPHPRGIYFLKVQTADNIHTEKIILQ